jgi:DNA-binding response OmpR family regulator
MDTQRILVADDNAELRRTLGVYLAADGYEVLEAMDGDAALQMATRQRFDLMLLDVMMPGLTGLEVLQILRATGNRVRVLLISSLPGDELGDRAKQADGFVRKPFRPQEVLERVASVLQHDISGAFAARRRNLHPDNRRDRLRTIIHEMRNHLAVAVASIEAFVDGKLEPTPARLRGLLQELAKLDGLIEDIGAGTAETQTPGVVSEPS